MAEPRLPWLSLWDGWIAGHGERVEARLEKLRSGRITRHPVEWVRRGSVGWFALAAILLNAVVAVAVARLVGGEPVGARRVRVHRLLRVLRGGLRGHRARRARRHPCRLSGGPPALLRR
jgi:hypothetical protein